MTQCSFRRTQPQVAARSSIEGIAMKRRLVSIVCFACFAFLTLVSTVSSAQVAHNYLNISCVWDPSARSYSILVDRFPGRQRVHRITDPSITSIACTSDPVDLMQWIQNDLQHNGTWAVYSGNYGITNDQLDTAFDVFCPDTFAPEDPTSIGSMMGTVYPPSYPGGRDQAGVVLNYTCPSTTYPPGSSPAVHVTASYATNTCANAQPAGFVSADDPMAVQMLNLGSNGNGDDDWITRYRNQSGPTSNYTFPSGTPHCDPALALLAGNYVQTQMNATSRKCRGGQTLQVAVDACVERGDDSFYGYQMNCCPAVTTHGSSTGMNCHSLCLPVSVNTVTHGYGPTGPTYQDPATACGDLAADTRTWMDLTIPGGPTQPWICGPNWGIAQGGYYSSGSLNMTCSVSSTSDMTCADVNGNPGSRIDVCLEYTCKRDE